MATAQDALPKKAGTSSCGVLRGILQSPVGLQQFKVLAFDNITAAYTTCDAFPFVWRRSLGRQALGPHKAIARRAFI
jgi:hypothetical protein